MTEEQYKNAQRIREAIMQIEQVQRAAGTADTIAFENDKDGITSRHAYKEKDKYNGYIFEMLNKAILECLRDEKAALKKMFEEL